MALETPPADYGVDEIGPDDEVLNYVLANHRIQIRDGGEPCYLLKPLVSGSLSTKTAVADWTETDPYKKTLWTLTPGLTYNINPNSGHPDLRLQSAESWGTGGLAVWIDGSLATRVASTDRIEASTHYCVEESEERSVSIVFQSGWDGSAHTVEYQYRTLCACVDWRQGSSTGQKQCQTCFGRGFEGGYRQYTVAADPRWQKPANTLWVRIPRALMDIKIMDQGLIANKNLRAWCMAPPDAPDIDNFDLIIRPSPDDTDVNEIEGIFYEVQDEQDSRIGKRTQNIWLHQDFQLKLIEETDVRNLFPLATTFTPGTTPDQQGVVWIHGITGDTGPAGLTWEGSWRP
jgi:hypothetical protein